MPNDRRRLIEVAFPLKQASVDSVREKNARRGHVPTLHILRKPCWLAGLNEDDRALTASRATIGASTSSMIAPPAHPRVLWIHDAFLKPLVWAKGRVVIDETSGFEIAQRETGNSGSFS